MSYIKQFSLPGLLLQYKLRWLHVNSSIFNIPIYTREIIQNTFANWCGCCLDIAVYTVVFISVNRRLMSHLDDLVIEVCPDISVNSKTNTDSAAITPNRSWFDNTLCNYEIELKLLHLLQSSGKLRNFLFGTSSSSNIYILSHFVFFLTLSIWIYFNSPACSSLKYLNNPILTLLLIKHTWDIQNKSSTFYL